MEPHSPRSSDIGVDVSLSKGRQRVICAANACAAKRLSQEIRNLETEAKFSSSKYDQFIKELKNKSAKMEAVLRESAARKAAMADKLLHNGDNTEGDRRRSGAARVVVSKTGKERSEELVSSLMKMIAFVIEHLEEEDEEKEECHLNEDDVTMGLPGVQVTTGDIAEEISKAVDDQAVQDTLNRLLINIEITPATPNLVSRESTVVRPPSDNPPLSTDDISLCGLVTSHEAPVDSPPLSHDGLRAAVTRIYGEGSQSQSNTSDVDVEYIIRRLQPVINRTSIKSLDGVGSNGTIVEKTLAADSVANDGHLNMLKLILNTEFPESRIQQQLDEKVVQRAKNREKKLWTRFKTMPMVLPPIHQQKKANFVSRYWDFDSPRKFVPPSIKEEDWEELKYCRYLRPAMNKFHVPGSTLFT